jgi:hypothetical protein
MPDLSLLLVLVIVISIEIERQEFRHAPSGAEAIRRGGHMPGE